MSCCYGVAGVGARAVAVAQAGWVWPDECGQVDTARRLTVREMPSHRPAMSLFPLKGDKTDLSDAPNQIGLKKFNA